ncbi:Non-reducing polyketide synthase nscA [Colletotrichum spinosum]|uniref:Non-reducing polyketide synthase nscA n=1 Tax=Colletotrichum spinosum TaxID=1347390 RepID=A0A4R8QSQ4_9PEZI|nr:Non-reducing polyketide synthase nscA [Colletotrichum spinosum]
MCPRCIHHHTRIAVTASNLDELRRRLTSVKEIVGDLRPVPTSSSSVAFTFTGQGTYYEGISSHPFHHFPFYRQETEKTTPSTLETPTTTLVVEIALSRFWGFMSVVPSAVLGHSLGEYAVLVAAAGSHVMLSVRAGIDTINSAMRSDSSAQFELSCVNGLKDNVVSGERADMDRVKSRLESISLKCMVLDIPYAFHAAQLDFAAVLQTAR